MCGGQMRLNESRRIPNSNAMMCFFRCTQCGVEYARATDSPAPSMGGPIDPVSGF
jgi:hypothetical protein